MSLVINRGTLMCQYFSKFLLITAIRHLNPRIWPACAGGVSEPRADLRQNLPKLAQYVLLTIYFRTIYNHEALEKIPQLIVALESIECVLDHFKDPDKINHMRKEFDDALNLSNQLPVCFRKPILGKHRLHLTMNCISHLAFL
jgi:hypothetical protein